MSPPTLVPTMVGPSVTASMAAAPVVTQACFVSVYIDTIPLNVNTTNNDNPLPDQEFFFASTERNEKVHAEFWQYQRAVSQAEMARLIQAGIEV